MGRSDELTDKDLLRIIKEMSKSAHEEGLAEEEEFLFQLPEVEEELDEFYFSENDGTVEVKDGKIIVRDPVNDGRSAKIKVLPPIILMKNGQPVEGTVMVSSTDQLEWQIEDTPLYELKVTEDNMCVTLTVFALKKCKLELVDAEPVHCLALRVKEVKEEMRELTTSEVYADLVKLKVKRELIKLSVIHREIRNPSYQPVCVVEGVPPVEGKDGSLELFVSTKVEEALEEVQGKVDFRNRLKIPSVKKGDLIGKIHTAVPGKPGYDVFGQVVHPRPVKEVKVVPRDHVSLNEEGILLAQQAGRPRVTGSGRVKFVDITRTFIVSGNLDIETGNIVFSGDVVVYGDVLDGMTIEALGDVFISGSVFSSTITATGNVTIKGNVVDSSIHSGYFGVIYNQLYQQFSQLLEKFIALETACLTVLKIAYSSGKNVSLGRVLITLMETKFSGIKSMVKKVEELMKQIKEEVPDEIDTVYHELVYYTKPYELMGTSSQSKVKETVSKLKEAITWIESMQVPDADVEISQCTLSQIKANGNILIKGAGTFNSQLLSKENIYFFQLDAVCRGGRVQSGKNIIASMVGGDVGGEVHLIAAEMIKSTQFKNGRITIKGRSEEIFKPIDHLVAYVRDGKLIIESS
ncbi:FapA family protein [Microaerobacter geothermalis]|uniref:FapA family protein n=1 Tax=Microaerobacter geothermalis TaxID=674972 RepID=UPI001F1EEF16|nr:FapA family protein [Microaerobacter geothermalis]MCF6095346.1 FapA family protein [Microaerobacter geothermalis]